MPRIPGLFSLLFLAIPIVKSEVITRYDVNDIWKPHESVPVEFDVPEWPFVRRPGLVNDTVAEKPFNFVYECSASATYCDKVQFTFEAVGRKIAGALKIRSTINVLVKVYFFGSSTSLGRAGANAHFAGRTSPNGTSFSYPQALVKQYLPDKPLIYNAYDITAEFNSGFDFWFPSDTTAIRSTQYDFEYVVAHEITHGLGFASNWLYWNDFYSSFGAAPSLLMPFFTVSDGKYRFELQTPFSSFLYGLDGSSFSEFANEMYAFPGHRFFRSFLAFFQQRRYGPLVLAQRAFNHSTSNFLQFRTPQNSRIWIYSPRTYASGSSLSHFDTAFYYNSAEFLMTHSLMWRGYSMASILQMFSGLTGYYGPLHMEVFRAIGWKRANDTGYGIMYMSPNNAGVPRSLVTGSPGDEGTESPPPTSDGSKAASISAHLLFFTFTLVFLLF